MVRECGPTHPYEQVDEGDSAEGASDVERGPRVGWVVQAVDVLRCRVRKDVQQGGNGNRAGLDSIQQLLREGGGSEGGREGGREGGGRKGGREGGREEEREGGWREQSNHRHCNLSATYTR